MTVAPALISMFASGLPTVRPLPITTTCFPFNSVCNSARTIQARGMAGAVKTQHEVGALREHPELPRTVRRRPCSRV